MDTYTNKLKPITRLSCEDLCVYLGIPFSIANPHAVDEHLTKKFTKYCSAITRRYLPVDLKVLLLNTIAIPAIEYPIHTHLLSTKTLATLERTARSCLRSTLCIFGKYNSSIFKNKLTCLSIRNITTLQHRHFLNHYVNRILNDDNSASRTLNILMNNYYSQPSTNPANHLLQLHNPGATTRSKLKTITQLLLAAAAVVTATTRYSAPPLGCHTSFNVEASAIAYALEATASIPSVHIISDNKAMVYLLNEPPKRPPLKAVAAWRIISQHLQTHNISIAHVYSHQEKKTSKEWKEKIAKQRLLHPNDYDQ
ncbi:hypothetical protein QOT17_025204 [Balamuthia mandrillaris]